uniref:Uncharacterized protein n=1 Tax=Onchocerca volvulus TaxID=6282 RepID=A0A8R1XXB4_ONCVO
MASSFRCSTTFLGTLTTILYYRYIIVPLILVLRIVDAVTCPSESSGSGVSGSSSSSSSLNKPTALSKRKVCPDFKDNEDEKYCCPSHIIPGSYYCCSQEHLHKIEAEQAAEIRRQFIKNYLAVIIVGVIGTIILLTVMTMCLCKNLSFCPMNAAKSTCSTAQHAQQHYRPVDTLSTKPVTYEAPPPYESSLNEDPQRRNDWHCLLENQVNDTRQDGAIFQ